MLFFKASQIGVSLLLISTAAQAGWCRYQFQRLAGFSRYELPFDEENLLRAQVKAKQVNADRAYELYFRHDLTMREALRLARLEKLQLIDADEAILNYRTKNPDSSESSWDEAIAAAYEVYRFKLDGEKYRRSRAIGVSFEDALLYHRLNSEPSAYLPHPDKTSVFKGTAITHEDIRRALIQELDLDLLASLIKDGLPTTGSLDLAAGTSVSTYQSYRQLKLEPKVAYRATQLVEPDLRLRFRAIIGKLGPLAKEETVDTLVQVLPRFPEIADRMIGDLIEQNLSVKKITELVIPVKVSQHHSYYILRGETDENRKPRISPEEAIEAILIPLSSKELSSYQYSRRYLTHSEALQFVKLPASSDPGLFLRIFEAGVDKSIVFSLSQEKAGALGGLLGRKVPVSEAVNWVGKYPLAQLAARFQFFKKGISEEAFDEVLAEKGNARVYFVFSSFLDHDQALNFSRSTTPGELKAFLYFRKQGLEFEAALRRSEEDIRPLVFEDRNRESSGMDLSSQEIAMAYQKFPLSGAAYGRLRKTGDSHEDAMRVLSQLQFNEDFQNRLGGYLFLRRKGIDHTPAMETTLGLGPSYVHRYLKLSRREPKVEHSILLHLTTQDKEYIDTYFDAVKAGFAEKALGLADKGVDIEWYAQARKIGVSHQDYLAAQRELGDEDQMETYVLGRQQLIGRQFLSPAAQHRYGLEQARSFTPIDYENLLKLKDRYQLNSTRAMQMTTDGSALQYIKLREAGATDDEAIEILRQQISISQYSQLRLERGFDHAEAKTAILSHLFVDVNRLYQSLPGKLWLRPKEALDVVTQLDEEKRIVFVRLLEAEIEFIHALFIAKSGADPGQYLALRSTGESHEEAMFALGYLY